MGFKEVGIESIGVEVVTPESAKEMLKGNSTNRPLSSRLVKAYSRDMENGDFKTTHQGIALNSKGEVVDGQHRLQAIIDAGVPIRLVVARYSEECTALDMPLDLQKRRHVSDILGMDRRTVETFYFMARELTGEKGRRMETEIMRMFELHPNVKHWYENNITKTKANVITSAPVRAAVAMAYISGYDWSEQYRAMVLLSFDDMESTTFALYKKLLSSNGKTAGNNFRYIAFGATYAAATTMGQIKVFKDATLRDAWAKAKEVYAKYMKEE